MTETEYEVPDGIQLSIVDGPYVIVEFTGCDVPPIRLTPKGAVQVGTNIQSGATRAKDGKDL